MAGSGSGGTGARTGGAGSGPAGHAGTTAGRGTGTGGAAGENSSAGAGTGGSPRIGEVILNGTRRLDEDDEPIDAHTGNILQVGEDFYWFGIPSGRVPLSEVAAYHSTDLRHWGARKLLFEASDENRALDSVSRPNVFRSPATGQYVMWLARTTGSNGNNLVRDVLVATSDAPDGPYTYLRSFRPLHQLGMRDPYDDSFYAPPPGYMSNPGTVFVDTDGTGYFASSREGKSINIYRVSDDYLDIDSLVATLFEGQDFSYSTPVLFKREGVYFLVLSSSSSGELFYASTTDLQGVWHGPVILHGAGAPFLVATAVLPLSGQGGTELVLLGDTTYGSSRASYSTNVKGHGQAWLPLSFPTEGDLDSSFGPALEIDAAGGRVAAFDALFSLVNVESGLALDVAGADTTDGAHLVEATANGARSQSWSLEFVGDSSFLVVNAATGLAVTNLYGSPPNVLRLALAPPASPAPSDPTALTFAPAPLVNPADVGPDQPDQYVIFQFAGGRLGPLGDSTEGAPIDSITTSDNADLYASTLWKIVATEQ